MAKNGYLLVEVMIAIMILGALIGLTRPLFNLPKKIKSTLHAQTIYHKLHLTQQTALTSDVDTEIEYDTTSTVTGRKVGFKSTGNTKYAGSILVGNFPHQKRISVGVGHGQIRLY